MCQNCCASASCGGMIIAAYRAGANFRDIKRQGAWRHDGAVHGYIKDAGIFDQNAARSVLRLWSNRLGIALVPDFFRFPCSPQVWGKALALFVFRENFAELILCWAS